MLSLFGLFVLFGTYVLWGVGSGGVLIVDRDVLMVSQESILKDPILNLNKS